MRNIHFLKIIVLALILSSGAHYALGWSFAPANQSTNSPAPLNIGADLQDKAGALTISQTSDQIGVRVVNGIYNTGTANRARFIIDELNDASGAKSGIELRGGSRGNLFGGFFKNGDSNDANNDIAIWNISKAVLTVKQNDTTEFAGQIKILGGNFGEGKVLTTDAQGNATWVTPPNVTSILTLGPISTFTAQNVERPEGGAGSSGEIINSVCPNNKVMVGFHLLNVGNNFSNDNPIYCR